MADRIQQRRDTKARWEQYNPILLEGELGMVTDNVNLYKIGDGVHRWNDLPYRGFNGNITSSLDNDENAVPSNKAIKSYLDDYFTELKANIVEFTFKDYGTAISTYGGAPKIDYGNATTVPELL